MARLSRAMNWTVPDFRRGTRRRNDETDDVIFFNLRLRLESGLMILR